MKKAGWKKVADSRTAVQWVHMKRMDVIYASKVGKTWVVDILLNKKRGRGMLHFVRKRFRSKAKVLEFARHFMLRFP